MNIIEKMRQSGVKLLQTQSEDIAKWSKCRHTKEDLELLLNFNIAEIEFRKADGKFTTILCTSNMPLVKALTALKKDDQKRFLTERSTGIRTADKMSVDTWDLIDNKRKTMLLTAWQITNFISITSENSLVLIELLKNILKR